MLGLTLKDEHALLKWLQEREITPKFFLIAG